MIRFTLWKRKLWQREVRGPSQGHTAGGRTWGRTHEAICLPAQSWSEVVGVGTLGQMSMGQRYDGSCPGFPLWGQPVSTFLGPSGRADTQGHFLSLRSEASRLAVSASPGPKDLVPLPVPPHFPHPAEWSSASCSPCHLSLCFCPRHPGPPDSLPAPCHPKIHGQLAVVRERGLCSSEYSVWEDTQEFRHGTNWV